MPGNGLALAVRIGCEVQGFGALQSAGDGRHLLGAAVIGFPGHRKIVFRPHRAILGRQIADMAVGGQDGELVAQIFIDRLGLGGRFDDDDISQPIVPFIFSIRVCEQCNPVAGQGFHPSSEFKFKENRLDDGGGQLAVPGHLSQPQPGRHADQAWHQTPRLGKLALIQPGFLRLSQMVRRNRFCHAETSGLGRAPGGPGGPAGWRAHRPPSR